jgi:hypothetical protein
MLTTTFDLQLSMSSDDGPIEATIGGFGLFAPLTASAITPAIVSPIALRTIVIQLSLTYPATGMTKDDFTVMLVPEELELTYLTVNNEGKRELNVVAVDPVDKTVTVKYGGAYSGTYDVVIKSKLNGNVETSGV